MKSRRVLFCIDSTAYLRHISPVIGRFAESDNFDVEVIFLGSKDKLRENTLQLLSAKVSKLDILYASHRKLNLFFQELLSLFVFLHPSHSSPLLIKRSSLPSFLKLYVLRAFSFISRIVGLTFLQFEIYIRFYYFLILSTNSSRIISRIINLSLSIPLLIYSPTRGQCLFSLQPKSLVLF